MFSKLCKVRVSESALLRLDEFEFENRPRCGTLVRLVVPRLELLADKRKTVRCADFGSAMRVIGSFHFRSVSFRSIRSRSKTQAEPKRNARWQFDRAS